MKDEMYREFILQHYRRPRNHGALPNPDIQHEDNNPLCGDQIEVTAKVADEHLDDIRFQGKGCAISQASASIMTGKVKGLSLEEIKALDSEDVLEWIRIPVSPMRVKCAMLGLKVLQAGIYERERAAAEG